MNMGKLPYKRSTTQLRIGSRQDRLMVNPGKQGGACGHWLKQRRTAANLNRSTLPQEAGISPASFLKPRVFRINPQFRLSPSIFSRFGGQGKPLCCPSSRSIGIELYRVNEQTCRRLI